MLVIDDTAIAKKGTHSVGVAAQYASALGKTANCQTLVSLTLARGEVPVMCPGRISNGTNQAGVGSSGDRSCHRGRCALWLRAGGCRLWDERSVSSGAHSSQADLGRRYPAPPQGLPCRCADDLAGCQARS